MEVETSHPVVAECAKQPSAHERANHPQQHVQYHAFTAMIHDMTGNESGDQTQSDPDK